MPQFDFSSADMALVAGQEVDLLQIANQIVWQKPAVALPRESIFAAFVPAGEFTDGPVTVGTAFYTFLPGLVVASRFWAPSQVELGRKAAIYRVIDNVTGTQLGEGVDLVTTVNGGWNTTDFPAPISIVPGTRYLTAVYYPTRYVATSHFFDTGPGSVAPGIVNGNLNAPEDGASHNGKFSVASGGPFYPNDSFQGNCYFADIVFVHGDVRLRTTSWTPPNTDNGNNEHNLGWDFRADVGIVANGLWWWMDGAAPPPSVRAQLWDNSQALIADSGTVLTNGFIGGAWNFIPFVTPRACAANTTYSVSVYSTGTYRYSSTDLSSDQFDASGHVRALAHTGRFLNAAGPNFPTSTWDGMFGVDLDFTIA